MRFFVLLTVTIIAASIAIGIFRSRNAVVPTRRPSAFFRATTTVPYVVAPSKAPATATAATVIVSTTTSTPASVPTSSPATSTSATSTPVPLVSPPPAFAAFTIEADDVAFYPATLTVHRNTVVSLTFRVRAAGVGGDGLTIRSQYFDTGFVAASGTKTVSFSAPPRPETIPFSSYSLGAENKKADGILVVD